jgi:hypothetical protein
MNEREIRLSEDLMLIQRRYNAMLQEKDAEIDRLKSLLDRATSFEAPSTTGKRLAGKASK